MALTITANDNNFNLSTGLNIVYAETNTLIYPAVGGVYNFKFHCKVTYKTDFITTKEIEFTQSIAYKNNTLSYAVLDFSSIFKTIVTPMITTSALIVESSVPTTYDSIHNIPYNTSSGEYIFNQGILEDNQGMDSFRGVANVLEIEFSEFYSTTENGVPTIQGTPTTKEIFLLWGRGEEQEGFAIDFTDYKLENATRKFLSSNYNIKESISYTDIGYFENHTLALLNRCSINTNALPYEVTYSYYDGIDGTGSFLGSTIVKNTQNTGGKFLSTLDDERFYLFFPAGLPNINRIDLTNPDVSGVLPSSLSGVKSYVIRVSDFSGIPKSINYVFNLINYCNQYDKSRLAFMNRFGAWEYITLNKERTDELSIKREYVTKPIINQNVGLSAFSTSAKNVAYPLNVAKQGKMTTSVQSEITTTMWTDNLEEDWQIDQIQDLMQSPQIHLLSGISDTNKAQSLILTNSKMQLKRDKNRGIKQYELKFSFANPKYRTTN